MPVLGLHTFALAPEWDVAVFERNLERLRKHNVGVLEVPLLRPEDIDTETSRRFATATGLRLVPSLGLPSSIDVISDPDIGIAFLENAFRVAVALGADVLSGVTYGSIGQTSGSAPTQDEHDGLCRFLQMAAAQAQKHGLRLGVEPCNRYETHLMNTARQATNYIEAVGADNIFIHLDTYHMHIEEQSFETGFADAGQHLGYVHLSESNRGVPGDGMINWEGVFNGLKAVNYDGPVTLESMNFVDRDIAGGLAIWRPVADEPSDVVDRGLPFLTGQAASAGVIL